MASSPVVQVRQWLRDQFEAVLAGQGVSVHYARPAADDMGKECVWFMPARTTLLEPAAHRAATYRRTETVVQPFVISVAGDGLTQEAADERLLELYGLIDEAAASTTFVQAAAALSSGQQIESLRLTGWQLGAGPQDDGHVAELLGTFGYTARYL